MEEREWTHEELQETFATEINDFRVMVCEKSQEVDPNEEMDWWAISYGFFMGKGVDPNASYYLSTYVRYACGYWM